MAVSVLFIGTTELLLISGVALLLFGGKKLPEMMRGLGQGVNEFKKGMREVKQPLREVEETLASSETADDAQMSGHEDCKSCERNE